MDPPCINLRERFGEEYKIEYEESYYAQYGENARVEDPWYMIIPCKHGHIYPQGYDELAVSTDKRGAISGRISRLEFVRVLQEGSDGTNAASHVDHFDEIAEIIKPRRRRRLSAEQKRLAVERLSKYQFGSARQVENPAQERPQEDETVSTSA